jgi:hypothetical protein
MSAECRKIAGGYPPVYDGPLCSCQGGCALEIDPADLSGRPLQTFTPTEEQEKEIERLIEAGKVVEYVSNDPTEVESRNAIAEVEQRIDIAARARELHGHLIAEDETCWCDPLKVQVAPVTVQVKDEPTADDAKADMRVFESGATRNVEVDPDYHGFLSPLALHAYGEYMHRHRLQADGTLRDSDNWQKGIPNDAFVRSLVRHVHDLQLVFDGYGELARQDDRDDNVLLAHLSAALFNIQGMLHNVMLAILEDSRKQREIEELILAAEEFNAT